MHFCRLCPARCRDDARSVSLADLRTACVVLNTADYCGETTAQVRSLPPARYACAHNTG